MKLIIGLGNPEEKYEKTRHNVGFNTINKISEKYQIPINKEKFQGLYGTGIIQGQKVILLKPQTYMNNSGIAVLALMTFYKIPLENLVVIHDDMDLAVGTLKEKVGGGSAGHNGIKSIDANVGRDYRRIRIGIGHPRDFNLPMDPADWVLGRFMPNQITEVSKVIKDIKLFK